MSYKQDTLMQRRRLNLNSLQNSIQQLSIFPKNRQTQEKKKKKQLKETVSKWKRLQNDAAETTLEQDENNDNFSPKKKRYQRFPLQKCNQQLKFENQYEFIRKIGEGAHGIVGKCKNNRNGKFYAVKTLEMEDEHFLFLKTNFMDIKRLTHKSIIKYKAIYINPKQRVCNIVMEFCPQPHLRHGMTEAQLQRAFFQFFDALSYLHSNYICHRDIKPDNILFDEQTGDIKLIDFGVSKNLKRRGQYEQMLTNTGTYYYKAPEMFKGAGYTEAVDCWAAGISLYEMITGVTPFASVYHSETIKNICEQPLDLELPEFQKFSPLVKDLISRLLRRDPKERLSCKQAKQHLWFASNQNNLIETISTSKETSVKQVVQNSLKRRIQKKSSFNKELPTLLNEQSPQRKGLRLKRKTTFNKQLTQFGKDNNDLSKTDKKVMKAWLQIINQDVRSIRSQNISLDFVQSEEDQEQLHLHIPSNPCCGNQACQSFTKPKHKSISA